MIILFSEINYHFFQFTEVRLNSVRGNIDEIPGFVQSSLNSALSNPSINSHMDWHGLQLPIIAFRTNGSYFQCFAFVGFML